MKDFIFTIIIGIILGIVFQVNVGNNYYGVDKEEIQHDTIHKLDTILVDKPIMPKQLVISVDSVNIDTMSTVINGAMVDKKYHITFK